MTRLIVSRLIQLPAILAVVFVATFVLAWVAPGNPLERASGRQPPEAVQEAMRRQYNLHSSWAFATSYLRSVLLRGDLGPSLQYRDQRVNDILARGLPVSAALGFGALVLALLIGVGVGVIGALKPGSLADALGLGVALVGVSVPSFVVGTGLLILFAGYLEWAPVGGWGAPRHVVLPALTLSLAPAAYVARLTRLGLADVMRSEYIRAARAKGVGPARLVGSHALKVAILPVVSFLGPAAATTLTGSFVVEEVFAIPGLGEHFVRAVLNKDQFLILGIVLVYATLLILLNLLVDVIYGLLDPRIEI